ncbi:MAG: low-specificity L-threonine aldolase [Pseudomonadales bacterium]|jgi:threonine aldolase|nr:low-specificity L-threonine aldolase [Pseudomonadales bacterium]
MIDLRSDTVTKPSAAMRQAMAGAEVGDDVWGDDPTVARLEALTAELVGKEAGLFVPSGTQSNLVALLTHCQRGDEYLVGQDAHIYRYEGGGGAVFGGIQPQPLPVQADGGLALEHLRAAIKPDDVHFARTRLLCLENTIHGRVLPQAYVVEACALADAHGLVKHLDGARLFNAAIKSGSAAQDLTRPFDSVSVCLSKGLGAPVGSVLCAGGDFIKHARRWRKMLGGGMRQSGILAAAGIYALQHNIERLAEDHANAALLAAELSEVTELHIDPTLVQTNMLFVRPKQGSAQELTTYLQEQGILVDPGATLRLVTHLDVSRSGILTAARVIKSFYAHN